MRPQRLSGGRLLVPRRVESPDGGVGDGTIVIGRDDPEYPIWDEYLRAVEQDTTAR